MRISDWSSDVCSSDLTIALTADASDARMNVFSTDNNLQFNFNTGANIEHKLLVGIDYSWNKIAKRYAGGDELVDLYDIDYDSLATYDPSGRSEEHTSELQSLMRISYAVFCLKKKKQHKHIQSIQH